MLYALRDKGSYPFHTKTLPNKETLHQYIPKYDYKASHQDKRTMIPNPKHTPQRNQQSPLYPRTHPNDHKPRFKIRSSSKKGMRKSYYNLKKEKIFENFT